MLACICGGIFEISIFAFLAMFLPLVTTFFHGDLRAGSPYFRRKFGCLASEASVKNNQTSLG